MSLFMLIRCINIIIYFDWVMSLLRFNVFSHVCHSYVYFHGEHGKQKVRRMVDVQITKYKYRRNQSIRI